MECRAKKQGMAISTALPHSLGMNFGPLIVASALGALASCQSPAPYMVEFEMIRGHPSSYSLLEIWKRDCRGSGGFYRPDVFVSALIAPDGAIEVRASAGESERVGFPYLVERWSPERATRPADHRPVKNAHRVFPTVELGIAGLPRVVSNILTAETPVSSKCAMFLADQSLTFGDVMLLHRAIASVGFRHVTFMNQEAEE